MNDNLIILNWLSSLYPLEDFEERAFDILWSEIGNNQQPLYCTRKELCDALEMAEDAIRRTQPENRPLTLDQLQKGDVVWIKGLTTEEIECLRFDRIEPGTYHSGDDYRFEQFGTDVGIIRWACKYGINWIAYRTRPEEEK